MLRADFLVYICAQTIIGDVSTHRTFAPVSDYSFNTRRVCSVWIGTDRQAILIRKTFSLDHMIRVWT